MPTFQGPFSNDDVQSNNAVKKLNVSRIELDFSSPLGTYNLGENLPANSVVLRTIVNIEIPFDGNPKLTIGNTTNPKLWMDESCVDLKIPGIYLGTSLDLVGSLTQARAFWNPEICSKGRMSLSLEYSDP
ncbi:hypothetical protein [Leptospira kmetyi]|uniref:Uncharacterized protein n=1 Tax=Leptospira kmetyi TaxID=408139 RepID=A0ABX4N6Q5_9LEPT|nr:hypothetical protein [Leptospira kmetyi]PJZ29087.1 hypothetical protein CH378_14470 [Leptospira kmetyi]PJZ39746.1 hypothetical protein CH370_20045 [Leptospira kmetyi]